MATLTASAAQSTQPAIYRENADIVRVVKFSQSASFSAGDVIQFVKIPQGAIVTNATLAWSFSAGVVTGDWGDGNDISAYAAGTVMSAVSQTSVINFRALGRSYSAEDTIDFVISGVSTPPANAQITLVVHYTCQNGG